MQETSLAPKAISVEVFRKITGLGRNTAYGLLNVPGGVRALRVGSRWIIPMVEVDRWLEEQAGKQCQAQ